MKNSEELIAQLMDWFKGYDNGAYTEFILTANFRGVEKVWSGSILTQSYVFASPSKVAAMDKLSEAWVNYSVCNGLEGGYVEVAALNDYVAKQRAALVNETKAKERGTKYDDGKLLMSLVQPEFTEAVAEVLTFGATKYGPNNWQKVDNAETRYLDALLRHLSAYRRGESVDSESGMSHLAHAATNIMFLIHFDRSKDENKS